MMSIDPPQQQQQQLFAINHLRPSLILRRHRKNVHNNVDPFTLHAANKSNLARILERRFLRKTRVDGGAAPKESALVRLREELGECDRAGTVHPDAFNVFEHHEDWDTDVHAAVESILRHWAMTTPQGQEVVTRVRVATVHLRTRLAPLRPENTQEGFDFARCLADQYKWVLVLWEPPGHFMLCVKEEPARIQTTLNAGGRGGLKPSIKENRQTLRGMLSQAGHPREMSALEEMATQDFQRRLHYDATAGTRWVIFDSLGRARLSDLERHSCAQVRGRTVREQLNDASPTYNMYLGQCWQKPDSDTCGAWTIFSLMRAVIRVSRPTRILPVMYSGIERDIDALKKRGKNQFAINEALLFRNLAQNLMISNPIRERILHQE